MELQWPLILFTTFIAWSAGLFGAQSCLALTGGAKKSQVPSLIISFVLMVIGGIAVFFHLQHWERIFNGFGHITSGITQELIAIVVVVILMVITFVMLRRAGDDGKIPSAVAIINIIVAAILVAVMAHSYMMAARPAWDSVLWILAVLGEACILGPATLAVIMGIQGDELAPVSMFTLIGSVINLVTTAAYAIFIQASGGAFTNVGYYFDPTNPTQAMADAAGAVGAQAPLLWIGAVIIGAVVPVICAFIARSKNDANSWKIWGVIAVIATLIGAVCLRMVFYALGFSVFMFY